MNKMIFCIQFVIILIFMGTKLLGFSIQLDDTPFEEYSNEHYVITLANYNFSPCIDTGHPDEQYNDADGTPSNMGAVPAISHDYFLTSMMGMK